jgi:hypothetical protein
MIGGLVAILWGVEQATKDPSGVRDPQVNPLPIVLGVAGIRDGRIYGLVDSYSSTGDYNRELAQRLGLPVAVSLGVTPLRAGADAVAWAPSLQLRF